MMNQILIVACGVLLAENCKLLAELMSKFIKRKWPKKETHLN